MGALLFCASSTNLIIWDNVVSFPTFLASNLKLPVLLIVAPITSSPVCFSTGIDSPVIIDSSRVDCPSIITPSTGIFSPGRTKTMSPIITSSTAISTPSA